MDLLVQAVMQMGQFDPAEAPVVERAIAAYVALKGVPAGDPLPKDGNHALTIGTVLGQVLKLNGEWAPFRGVRIIDDLLGNHTTAILLDTTSGTYKITVDKVT